MIAMQTATDNADELKGDLTIQYNKQRQQAVTNELLDIIGGANASRWLKIPIINISFQPSSIGWIAIILYLSYSFS